MADLKIGILGEMNRNSANDSEREAFSASRESAFLKRYSRPRSSGESRNATLEAIRRPVASARSRPLVDCAHTTESYGPEPPTPADLKREADHEKLVRVFPVVGETIEPNKTYAGAKSRRRFRISNIHSADPLPSFAAPSTRTEPDFSLEIGAIAGGQKRRGYGGELRECSDTDPWRKRAKPILIDLDPIEFADLIALVIK